jgi:signal recognition particle subunit SRP54
VFDTLSDRLEGVFKKLRGQGVLTEKNIQDALREVRIALLEADVNFAVVKRFIERVRKQAVGVEVTQSLTPGQQVIKVVHDELVSLMGDQVTDLNLSVQPPAVIMMVGLQGSGKTTTSAKLAKRLIERGHKRCLLASLDVYRPAAMDQLATVGAQARATVLPTQTNEDPRDIADRALDTARRQAFDVLILDTAGRLHVDDALMSELSDIKARVNPVELLLVADSMTGQDAVQVAQTFDQRLSITGVVLTKADGDARGGAALSIRDVTGKPIKFLGTGEHLEAIEPFHPDRMASRILGMGDVLTLVETAMEKVDLAETAKLQQKLQKSELFTLEDFLSQMQQIKKMGPVSDLMGMIPGLKQALKGRKIEDHVDEKKMRQTEAIILSMTIQERRRHQILNASRKRRIAQGAGTTVPEVNRLLKQFIQTQNMMKRLGRLGKKGFSRGGLPGLPF